MSGELNHTPFPVDSTDLMPAPPSAGFYYSNNQEQDNPHKYTWYSETYPSEWLPPLGQLFGDITYLIHDQHGNRKRRDTAIKYVDWLRDRTIPGQYAGAKEYSRGQATARLFLDSISLIARHRNYHSESAKKGRHSKETYQDLLEYLEIKRDAKSDIASYVRLSRDSPPDVIFNNILSIMNYSRKLIYDDESLSESAIKENRRNLIGMLAENKVVEALQYDRWPLAEHASAKLDSEGADVIVPVGLYPRHAVVLQVKSSSAPGGQFQIMPNHKLHMVVVPMNPTTNDPFRLGPEGTHQLNDFIYRAPRMKLPLAA